MNRDTIRAAWQRRIRNGYVPAVQAELSDDTTEGILYLYDPIDNMFGVGPNDVQLALDALGDVQSIVLHVNSPGGDVFDGIAILNLLRQHPAQVTAIVDGLAASAASFIAVGADETYMAPNAQMFIHDAWGICIGNADDMRRNADDLDTVSDNIASIYADATGTPADDWRDTMRAEAWYTDAQAVDAGLALSVLSVPSADDVETYESDAVPAAHYVAPIAASAVLRPVATITIDERNTMPNPPTPVAPVAPAPESVPMGLPAQPGQASPINSLHDLYAALVAQHTGRASRDILNVLQDITQTAIGAEVNPPEWVGELWSGVRYQRRVVPLVSGPALTSYQVNGWRWTTKPAVAAYSGDKADVPSNAVATEPVTTSASRLAGAHDIDRKFRDFGDTAFFESYYAAMAESYAVLSDAACVDAMETVATDIATPAYPGFLGAIAAGVASIDTATGADGAYVLANSADLIPFVLALTAQDIPALLSTIGVNIDRVRTHPSVTAGHVLVGATGAFQFRELPGSPIRVEAIDMVQGGVDTGVFGYYATLLNDAGGLVDVTIDTTP